MHGPGARLFREDQRIALAGRATVDGVRPQPGIDLVVVGAALDPVVAATAHDHVVAIAAEEFGGAFAGVDEIAARAAGHIVGAIARVDLVALEAAVDEIPAHRAVDRVAMVAAIDVERERRADRRGWRGSAIFLAVGPDAVEAGTTVDRVHSRSALDLVGVDVETTLRGRVAVVVAVDDVVAIVTEDLIIADVACDPIVAIAAEDRVVALAAPDPVGTIAGKDRVGPQATIDGVLRRTGRDPRVVVAIDRVVASVTVQIVDAPQAEEEVAVVAPLETIGGDAADESIAARATEEGVHTIAACELVVAVAARAPHRRGDVGGEGHHVGLFAGVEPDEVEVARIERYRFEVIGLDDDLAGHGRAVFIDGLLDRELLFAVLDARHHAAGPWAHVEHERPLRRQGRIDRPDVGDQLSEFRIGRRAADLRPAEEPLIEEVQRLAEERDEPEPRVEAELQVGVERNIEGALKIEDALGALGGQPREFVEMHLAVAVRVPQVRAERAGQGPRDAGGGDRHIQLSRGADRRGKRDLGPVVRARRAIDRVGEIKAVGHAGEPDRVVGEGLPDPAGVVADVEVRAELHFAEDPRVERWWEDKKFMFVAEADALEIGHVPGDEIDVASEQEAEDRFDGAVEDREGDARRLQCGECLVGSGRRHRRCGRSRGLLEGGRRGRTSRDERRQGIGLRDETTEGHPAGRGHAAERVGERRDGVDGVEERPGVGLEVGIPDSDQVEERHGFLARLLRQIGDQRHLHREQIGDRLDGLEGCLDLLHEIEHGSGEQATEIDADVGEREVKIGGIEAAGGDQFGEGDRPAVGDAALRIADRERGTEADTMRVIRICLGPEDVSREFECQIGLDARAARREHGRLRHERREVFRVEPRARADVERQRSGEFRVLAGVGRGERDRAEIDGEAGSTGERESGPQDQLRCVGRVERLDEEPAGHAEAEADVEREREVEVGTDAGLDAKRVEADVEIPFADRDRCGAGKVEIEDYGAGRPEVGPDPVRSRLRQAMFVHGLELVALPVAETPRACKIIKL